MTWGKRAKEPVGATTTPLRSSVARVSRRTLSATLAALLTVMLAPALPTSTVITSEAVTAEALTSTTDYSKVLEPTPLFGSPEEITGSTMRLASTGDASHYVSYGKSWGSCASFMSNDEVSFLHNWEIKFTGKMSSFPLNPDVNAITLKFASGFTEGRSLKNTAGHVWNYRRSWNASSSSAATTMYFCGMLNGMEQGAYQYETSASWSATQQMSFSYNARTDTGTLNVGSGRLSVPNIRAKCGDSAYLFFLGLIEWSHSGGASEARAPFGMSISATFNSMALPNLDPTISNIVLYRHNKTTDAYDIPVGASDILERDEVVLARCSIKNQNTSAAAGGYKEQFAMHLKLANTDDHPTQGITPFADNEHPLQVDDTTVATEPGDNTLSGAVGVPVTLIGNDEVSVTYYARVNQSSGKAIVLSHELIEDTFKGNQFATMKLIGEPVLKPGTDDDPDLVPGRDYHYTRLPIANENGWNGIATSPVTVRFYGGTDCDFDRFSITSSSGAPIAELTPETNAWTQTADVDALPVTFQATGSTTGTASTKDFDTIRIDTQAPTLFYNETSRELTASDAVTAESGKAMSGIWSIERVKADGRPLSAEDVTPQSIDDLILEANDAAPQTTEQTTWVFPLSDGRGAETQSVPAAQPGFYVAEDAAGNASAIFEVKEAVDPKPGPDDPQPPINPDNPDDPKPPSNPDDSGDDPSTTTPSFPTITPRPDPTDPSAPAPKPLEPTEVSTDPSTGLTHAVVTDTLLLPTSPNAITPAMMAQLIDERYIAGTNLDDGVTAGAVRLFDAEGNVVSALDRSHPGTWIAEQTFTDRAGNTTTIRLTLQIRENSVTGSTTQNGDSGGAGINGGGQGASGSHRTALATQLSQLPQTGGILGPCPLHILFVLMMIMASAYGLMRLRQRRGKTRSSTPDNAENHITTRNISAQDVIPQSTEEHDASEQDEHPQGATPFDGFVLGVISLCAIALGWLGFCPLDVILAAGTLLVCGLWAYLLFRPTRQSDQNNPAPTTC
ncbi:hypothetical protein VJ918_10800 [Adlercreutzia sp. R21]|uniref:hypothetical protein n=1 Tax=Adlercreutzia wanghongyangiae TaxID=3111451 RepID=UPI002DB57213|nr:hypothetical protein [Adlercreutzia sp. R21]MEC4185297.1 hypothetical protein [Adlercreutzia sp. R21]